MAEKKTSGKFDLGQVVMTRGIDEWIKSGGAEIYRFVCTCIGRHAQGDWGDCYPEDAKQNDEALKSGEERLFSVYKHSKAPDGKIWIITEWDRSITTILFPSEY